MNMKRTAKLTSVQPRIDGLNIVIFACVDFPEGPATTSRVKLLARILNDAGHHVSLAIFNANSKTPIPENSSCHGSHDFVEYLYLSGAPIRPTGFLDAVTDSLKGVVQSIFYLRQRKKADAIDCVLFYTPDIYRSLPCLILAKLYGIPILLELCEIFSTDRRKSGFKPVIQRWGACLFDRVLPGRCSGVLAISTKIVGYLRNQGLDDKKIMHLPILVDCDRFINSTNSEVSALVGKQYFLNSGALDGKEGLEYILEAFASLSSKHDQLYLVLTGAPEISRKTCIITLAKRLGIEHKLIFTGFLSLGQLSWAYQHARALICCRANTAFTNYGFPTKLGEYLSSGRPVIANEVGDTTLYLNDGENAFLTRSQDILSISSAMERVLRSPSLANEVGLKGRQLAVEKFDYANHVRPLDEFLRTICQK